MSNVQSGTYQVGLPVQQLGTTFGRNWVSVDVHLPSSNANNMRDFRFINTNVEGFNSVRIHQGKELLEVVANSSTELPIVLVGDFSEGSDEKGDFFDMMKNDGGFIDAWEEMADDNETGGYTAWHNTLLDDPTDVLEEGRLDHIMVRGAGDGTRTPKIKSVMFVDTPLDPSPDTRPYFPSDHAGVVAEIHIYKN